MEYPYFPMFVSLKGQKTLVAGAGAVAARRVKTLAEFGACVTVAAPECCEDFLKVLEAYGGSGEEPGTVVWRRRAFQESDLDGMGLVLAAAGDPKVNGRIAELCRERGIPVNDGSRKERSDFYFPGIAKDGELVIGVTASGRDHRLAREITETLRQWLADRRRQKEADR